MKAPSPIAGKLPDSAPGAAVAVVVVALSLESGGYGAEALGIAAALTWIAVLVTALGPARDRVLSRTFVLAAAALAFIAVFAAFSLGWSLDRGAGFEDVVRLSGYLGAFVLAGLLIRPGQGRSILLGLAAGLVAVSALALASRLAGIGGGDADLVASMRSSAGRLSYPVGYWNALGSMAAMAVPLLVWAAAEARGRAGAAIALGTMPIVGLTAYMTSSRGALIAIAIGAGVAIAASRSRGRAFAAFAVGVAVSIPAAVAATLGSGILDAPLATPGRAEAVVGAAVLVGVAAAALLGPPAVSRGAAIAIPGLRMRHVLAAAFAALVVLVLLAGPGRIAGDFAATSGREASTGSGDLSVTGSGRAQFWSTALDAAGDEPLRGIGAGSYGLYWNRYGNLETPVRNAHSEPLELLAELGIAGLAAFLVFFGAIAAAGVPPARDRGGRGGGPAAGAALGLIATGLVGVLIDWTWDVPATAVPILVAAALCANGTFAAGRSRSASTASTSIRIPAPAIALVAVVFAVPAIWAAGVLAASGNRLAASDEALAAGRLDDAATAARSAAAIEPWSSEPWLRLATIEQAAGNLAAARLDSIRAIELTPDDFRPWLLASGLEGELGNRGGLVAYGGRALILAPLVIPRASIEPGLGVGSGS
ncbi:MAG: O-antigen ligase family protein [Solirubrobacterales bacterium]